MFEPIIIKEVHDNSGIGDFWVELCQVHNCIKLSMSYERGSSDLRNSHKWTVLKKLVDKISDEHQVKTLLALGAERRLLEAAQGADDA